MSTCLNASYGARGFLTTTSAFERGDLAACLNAPYGARCFLTR
ncbi:homeobox protein Hox-C12 [Schaalia odontolytica]|uniref:Homeobox protein Hox-C12 n=1 Tax=Schaalia odontolytica TaxID=1660 RepID=A0A2I1HXM9_9ACTO|nr:homeobox protein Hox-C12 [Schaalia odontolytica]